MNLTIIKTLILLTLFAATQSANAQPHLKRGGGRWHGGDIRRFEIHDRGYWRGGSWRHSNYNGRFGWWWVVGPNWYFYSQPIYPYPNPYIPSAVMSPAQSQEPPPATSSASIQHWYFCEASKEYYPYVETCPGGWKIIPAAPLNK